MFLPSCNDEVDLVDTDAHSPEIAMNEKMEKLHYEKSGTTLAERFAPQIALHSCERLFPSDPEWYINRVKMEFTRKGSDQLIANPVSNNIIANRTYYEGPWNCRKHAENSGAGYHSNFYLQIPNDGNEQNTRRGNPNTNELRILVNIHERIGNSDIKEIQYWIFYPFNALCSPSAWCGNSNTECGGLDGAHEGDWEHITVNYSVSQDKAVGVYMSRHEGEGQTYSPSQILWLSEHPIVYSALGSHASYPTVGTHNRPLPLPSDHTNYGILIDTWTLNNYVIDDCEDFGCLNSPSAPNWLKYSGFWGELGATFANPIPGNGPVGPAYKLDFFSDLEANDSGFCEYPVGRGITFYEDSGTSCSGDYWTATDAPSQLLNVKERWGWSNDEIRSLVLSNVKDGTKIYLYDNDCGDTDDDYTIVTANRDIGFNELIKIGDLETSWSGGTHTVQHFHNNGLNGKVSLIKIQ